MDFFTFMLGYVSGVVACTLFTIAVTRRGSRRPKPNSGPPGPPTYTDLRTGVTTYPRPSTPANITAPAPRWNAEPRTKIPSTLERKRRYL